MAGSHQLFVADLETSELRLFAGSGAEGLVNGSAQSAALAQPSGLTVDGDTIYFADSETSSIRSIGIASGSKVSTIVGKGLFEFGDVDGGAGKARLQHPLGITAHDGLLYVADTYNSKIKVIDPARRTSATFAGSGKKALGQWQLRAGCVQRARRPDLAGWQAVRRRYQQPTGACSRPGGEDCELTPRYAASILWLHTRLNASPAGS